MHYVIIFCYFLHYIKIARWDSVNTPYDVFRYRNVTQEGFLELPPLMLPYYDLTMVVTGEMTYWAEEERIDLSAGDVMLLPPTTIRRREASRQATHYIIFNFHTEEKIELPRVMRGALTQEILSLFGVYRVPFYLRGDGGAGKINCLLGYALETLLENDYRAKQNVHIRKALDFISSHLGEPLPLTRVASHLCLTREYTASLFRKELGTTVSDFVNERKLLRACDLIMESGNNLPDIALILGFENYGYFSRIFKKHFGISPLQYKKNMAKIQK